MELKNSETLQNLMRAFAGESQARNRYTFAAEVCRQQKLQVLEAVFLFTAGQEKEHAEIFYNHMREITGGSVQIDGGYPVDLTHDVAELLRSAQRHEYEEHDPVYKSFGETARQEGFGAVAASFQQIAAIEQLHGNRFGAYADLLESGKLFVSDAACGWMCLNCGHVFTGTEAPGSARYVSMTRGISSVWSWRPTAPAPLESEADHGEVSPQIRSRLNTPLPELRRQSWPKTSPCARWET